MYGTSNVCGARPFAPCRPWVVKTPTRGAHMCGCAGGAGGYGFRVYVDVDVYLHHGGEIDVVG